MADRISGSIVVRSNITDVYNIWSNFEIFPEFMDHIKSVRITGERKSHWVMSGPLGYEVEWDAVTMEMVPNRRIAWESVGGDIDTSGEVTFEEISEDETRVNVTLNYGAPGQKVGETVARIIDNPQSKLDQDLQNFKQYVETVHSPLMRY